MIIQSKPRKDMNCRDQIVDNNGISSPNIIYNLVKVVYALYSKNWGFIYEVITARFFINNSTFPSDSLECCLALEFDVKNNGHQRCSISICACASFGQFTSFSPLTILDRRQPLLMTLGPIINFSSCLSPTWHYIKLTRAQNYQVDLWDTGLLP
jgi:hypothetical protein